jgi:branched-subunit amino acid ABC-type transport system permease component
MSWSFFLQQAVGGLSYAMTLFLIASGLSLILGVMGIVNFAHGSLYMIGAYLTWWVSSSLGASFWVGVLCSMVGVGVLGLVMQRYLISRLYGKQELQLLFTFAFVLIFGDLLKLFFGVMPQGVHYPPILDGIVHFAGTRFPTYNLFLIILGPIIAYLLHLGERKTRIGRVVRAAAANREMVATLGINVRTIFTVVFGLGALLAGLGGALASPTTSVAPGMDVPVVLPAFVAVVLGGLGSFGGTFLACLIIGQVQVFGVLWLPRLSESFVFILMALVLAFRPWGLSNKPLRSS